MNISFSDFWPGFIDKNNFFVDLLRSIFEEINVVPFGEKTDILIYSCFGENHLKANRNQIKKIFYTGENIRPNYNHCDFSLSFDFDSYGGKNYRFPFWMLHIDWFKKKGYEDPVYVHPLEDISSNLFSRKNKGKFCSIVFNNPSSPRNETIELFKNNYKKIDCFGSFCKNSFSRGEDKKLDLISNYKFNVCYENAIFPGYYTEKLFHAKLAGCVPIYWSDKNIFKDFNTKCFINLTDFYDNIGAMIEYVKEVDSNDKLYKSYVEEPMFFQQPSLSGIVNFLKAINLK